MGKPSNYSSAGWCKLDDYKLGGFFSILLLFWLLPGQISALQSLCPAKVAADEQTYAHSLSWGKEGAKGLKMGRPCCICFVTSAKHLALVQCPFSVLESEVFL